MRSRFSELEQKLAQDEADHKRVLEKLKLLIEKKKTLDGATILKALESETIKRSEELEQQLKIYKEYLYY